MSDSLKPQLYIIVEIIAKDSFNTSNLMQTFEKFILQNCTEHMQGHVLLKFIQMEVPTKLSSK